MSSAMMVVVVVAAVGLGEVEAGLACIANPCNNGVCVDHLNSSTFHCFCEDGFTGMLCQTNWDDCWSAPCLNGATCTDLVAGLSCTCPLGYTGEFCESEINECRSNPCQNNGTCHDMLNHYVCSCPIGYSGENCEIDVSVCNSSSLWSGDSPKCLHGGVCVDGPGLSYTCLCQPGWTGTRCEEDDDECSQTPCQNDAICVNTPGAFACACQFGFTGPLCEENLVFCESNPCKNDALCVMEEHNATCYCVPDYHGPQCQKQYNDCLPYAPRCMNGGVCVDGVDSFKCSCPKSTSGVLCQCVSTLVGQHCQPLPHWFQDKPYQTNVPFDRKFFGTQFNISYQQNDSVTTVREDVYMTSVSDTAEFPSAIVTSDYLIPSLLTPTISLHPMDVFTPSSVISAKISLMFSELPSITVPYFSSELYESSFPSSSIDSSLMEKSKPMQPTPVLPVLTSSPAPEESVTFYEYLTETSVLLPTPTTTLEGSFPTPSTESISLSLILVSDVSTAPSMSVADIESTPVLSPTVIEPPLLTPKAVFATLISTQDSVMAMFLPVDDRDGNLTQSTETDLNGVYHTASPPGNKLVPMPFTVTQLSGNVNTPFEKKTEAAFQVSITALNPCTSLTKSFLLPPTESTTNVTPLITKSIITHFSITDSPLNLTYHHHSVTYKTISSSANFGNSESTMQLLNSGSYILSTTETSTLLYVSTLLEASQNPLLPSVKSIDVNEDNNLITSASSKDEIVSGSPASKKNHGPATEMMSVTENVSECKTLPPHSLAPTLASTLGIDYHLGLQNTAQTFVYAGSSRAGFPSTLQAINAPTTASARKEISTITETTFHVSVLETPITPTTATTTLTPADQTTAISIVDGVGTPSTVSPFTVPYIFTTLIEFTPTPVFLLDAASTPVPSLKISATPTFPSEYFTTLTVPEILITPIPPTDIKIPSTPPPETDIILTFSSDITPTITETDITTTPLETETTPTPPTESEITSTSASEVDVTVTHPEVSLFLTSPAIKTTPAPEVGSPSTSREIGTTPTSVETTSTPMIETALTQEVETTPASNMTLASPTKDATTSTLYMEIPTTASLPSDVSTTLSSPPQVYTTSQPHDVLTTAFPPTQVSLVACGKSYCLNGGICHVTNSTYTCECPFNYRGASCQLYFYINKPYFVGASYLGLDVGNMSLRTGVQVYVQFTSQEENGLVAYSEGPGEAFFMLLLRNSLLQFVFSCGLNTVSFLQGNEKLTRNCLTDVSVKMWWTPYLHDTPWGPGKCSASLQVNGTDPVYSEQKSWSPLVQLGLLYLGGLPSSYSSPLVVKAGFLPRLKGCVSLLEVNGCEVDMWLSGVSGERVQECGTAPCPPQSCYNGGSCIPGPALWFCQCPKGYQGELCEHAECEGVTGPCHSGRCVPTPHHPLCLCSNHHHGLYCELESVVELPSYSGSVAGYSSYSSYRIDYDTTHTLAIRLHFSTPILQQVGLMAYIGNSVRASVRDFLALSLVRGHLMLTWDLGAGPRRIVTLEPLDHTLHTHTALIGRQGRWAWFVVDAQKNVSAKAPGFLSSLNTNNLLYIGGHPSWNMSHLPADMWRHSGFRGCVFDLRVAKSPEGPWTAVRVAAAFNVQECGRDPCQGSQNPCHNGGNCIALGATFRCECPLGWKGSKCEVPSHLCKGAEKSCHPGSSCLTTMLLQRETPICVCQLGRAGTLCDQAMNITDLQFSGEGSYASLQSTRSLRRESHVTLSFKPDYPNGILFLALPVRNSGDFMALVLVNGTLQFIFYLGLHAPGLVLLHSETTAKLDEWQTVTVSRVEGSGSMTFQGHTTQSISPAPTHAAALLDTHTEVFIGGVPDYSVVPPAAAPQEGLVAYRGCIRQVIINGIEHDLRVPDGGLLRGAGLRDCDGTPCGHQVCLHGGTCTPAGDTFVCTCTQAYLGRRCQLSRACINHQCINGATCMPTDEYLGRQKRRQKAPVSSTASWRTYNFFDRQDGDWLEEVVESYIKQEEEFKILKEKGNESTNGEKNIIEEMFSVRNGDLNRYREEKKKGRIMRKTEKHSNKKELLKKREVKGNNDQDFNYYRCLCPPGYHGIYCQTAGGWGGESMGARFSGYSFVVVGSGGHHGSPSPHLDSFALNFSTSAFHGLLLWRGQVEAPGEDYLGVGVERGRMKVVWHLGGGSLGHLLMKEAVSDGQWHSLVVVRHGAVVTTFLDGHPQKASSSGTYTQLNDPHGLLYIGGFPDDIPIKYGSEGHFQRPFVGCMRDLTVHQSSYPIRFSSLTQGQDLQPCS